MCERARRSEKEREIVCMPEIEGESERESKSERDGSWADSATPT
jgi:hypothetical protein